MRVYRICRAKRARSVNEALDGMGASKIGGRWSPKGMPVAYTSSSISLALLEILVHADLEDLPDDLVCASINIPDRIKSYELNEVDLPDNWRNLDPAPSLLADLGKRWVENKVSLLMTVPSVLIPSEKNILINPEHDDYGQLTGFKVEPFEVDPRLGLNFT